MRGGARVGAGRKGPNDNPFRKALVKFMDQPEVRDSFFRALKYHIDRNDKDILKWVGDQRAGKATQSVELDGSVDQVIYDTGIFTDDQLRKALERRRGSRGAR